MSLTLIVPTPLHHTSFYNVIVLKFLSFNIYIFSVNACVCIIIKLLIYLCYGEQLQNIIPGIMYFANRPCKGNAIILLYWKHWGNQ